MAQSAVVGTLRALLMADTSEFVSATKQASRAADDMAQSVKQAGVAFADVTARGASVTRLVKDFSGSLETQRVKEWAEAIGQMERGLASLSKSELSRAKTVFDDYLDKAKALGQQAPAHIQKLSNEINRLHPAAVNAGSGLGILDGQWKKLLAGFSAVTLVDRAITGIIRFGTEAVRSASHIVDLANKTGLSTEAIQRMEHVAKLTGTTVDAFTNAVFKLGVNIANATSKDNVGKGLEQLGINIAEIKRLKPEEQFELIAAKLAEMEEPQERNRVAVALFGRQVADTLPGIVENYKKLADGAKVASDASVRALDAASDAWDTFLEDTKNKTIEFLGTTVLALKSKEGLGEILLSLLAGGGATGNVVMAAAFAEAEKARAAAMKDTTAVAKDLAKQIDEGTKSTMKATAAISEHEQQYRRWASAVTGADVQKEVDQLTENVLRLMREGKFTVKALEEVWKQVETLEKKGAKLPPVLQLIRQEFVSFQGTGKSFFETFSKGSGAVERITVDFVDFVEVGKSFFDTFGPLPKSIETFTVDAADASVATDEWAMSFKDLRGGAFLAAGVLSDISQFAGNEFVSDMARATRSVGEMFDGFKMLSAENFLGGLQGIVGGAIGLIGTLSKHFKTLGRNIARDMQDAFATTELGFANLNTLMARLRELGAVDLVNRGDRAQRKDDEKETRKWMEDVRKFLDEVDRKAEKLFSGLADAAEQFGGKAPAALQPMIQELLRINALTEEQRALLEGLSGEPAWQDLQRIADTYGISLEALGSKFQNARLGDMALQYARDFNTLKEAGGDVNGLLEGMQDEVQALVIDALKFGTSMPEAMRPVLQGLIDMGKLTDENGNKLENLDRFQFSGTFEDIFKDMKTVLEEIRDLLSHGIPTAAAKGGKQTRDVFADAGEFIRAKFRDPIEVRVEFNAGSFSPPQGFQVDSAQEGGMVTKTGLVNVHAGEVIGPLNEMDLGREVRVDNRLYIDGREVTVAVVQNMREVARRLGVRPI